MNKSVLSIALLVLIACQATLGQWSLSSVTGFSQVTQLQLHSDAFFGICSSDVPYLRQLCRATLTSSNSLEVSNILPFDTPVSNFAVASPTNDLFFTGGLSAPVVVASRNNTEFVTSSFEYQQSSRNVTFAPHYFGTVVASAIDFLTTSQGPVLAQYHLAYDVDRMNNTVTWLVQRIVPERSDLDLAWTINDFIPARCTATFLVEPVYTSISTSTNGSKILSIGFAGPSRDCSGLYQFTLPTNAALNDLEPRRRVLFASSAMAINNDIMFYFSASLCRIGLVDEGVAQCTPVTANTDATQIVVNNNMLYVAYSMRWIEIYDLDLQSSLSNRFLRINVTADALAIKGDSIIMTYREMREGRMVAMSASAPVSTSFITLQQLQEPIFETVPTIYGADVVVGLAVSLAVAGVLAIVGWALFFVMRRKALPYFKADAHVMLNEQLVK